MAIKIRLPAGSVTQLICCSWESSFNSHMQHLILPRSWAALLVVTVVTPYWLYAPAAHNLTVLDVHLAHGLLRQRDDASSPSSRDPDYSSSGYVTQSRPESRQTTPLRDEQRRYSTSQMQHLQQLQQYRVRGHSPYQTIGHAILKTRMKIMSKKWTCNTFPRLDLRKLLHMYMLAN